MLRFEQKHAYSGRLMIGAGEERVEATGEAGRPIGEERLPSIADRGADRCPGTMSMR